MIIVRLVMDYNRTPNRLLWGKAAGIDQGKGKTLIGQQCRQITGMFWVRDGNRTPMSASTRKGGISAGTAVAVLVEVKSKKTAPRQANDTGEQQTAI